MEKKKKKLIFKSLVFIISLACAIFVIYYFVNVFLLKDSLLTQFSKWAKQNLVLTVFLFLLLSPIINICPGISSIFFITLGNALFNDKTVKGMLFTMCICAISVTLTSSLLFLLGRYGGKKVLALIVGKEEFERLSKLITTGGKAFLPMVYLLPFFPDDTISLLMGTTKMSFLYNFICSIIFRSTGVIVITLIGTDLFDYSSFSMVQWVIFIVVFLFIFALSSFLSYQYYRFLKKKELGIKFYLIDKIHLKNKIKN